MIWYAAAVLIISSVGSIIGQMEVKQEEPALWHRSILGGSGQFVVGWLVL